MRYRNYFAPFMAFFISLFLLILVGSLTNNNSDKITGYAVEEHDDDHNAAMPEMNQEAEIPADEITPSFNRSRITTILIFLFLVFGFGFIFVGYLKTHSHKEGNSIDLLAFPFVKKIVKSRFYPLGLQIPNAIIFGLVIYVGIFDLQDGGKNLATTMTWLLWWTLLIFTIVLFGRVWCMVCPFQLFGDTAQKIFSLHKKLPHKLRNLWMTVFGFLFMTWAYTYWSIGNSPFITAIFALFFIVGSLIVSMIYTKRTFCRNFCPIGGMIGIYSMVAPIELTVKEKNKIPPCQQACPVSQNVKGYMSLIAGGQFKEASELIRRDNPLPSVCGRVCDHPCEIECTRNDLEAEPLSIKALKRAAMDYGTENSLEKSKK